MGKCPDGHANPEGFNYCGTCGKPTRPGPVEAVDSSISLGPRADREEVGDADPLNSVASPEDTSSERAQPGVIHAHRRGFAIGAAVLLLAIGVVGLFSLRSTGSSGDGYASEDDYANADPDPADSVTQFGCPITPIEGFDGATQVDPTCTEGGVILEACPDVSGEMLKVPAYDTRQAGNSITNAYAVGDASFDGGEALVTHFLPSSGSSASGFTRITCPSGRYTDYTTAEWDQFLQPA